MALHDPYLLLDVLRKQELPTPFLAAAASIAGQEINDETPIPTLLQLLNHPSPHVREGAALGLQNHLNDEVLSGLQKRLEHDESPGVRSTIEGILEDAAAE